MARTVLNTTTVLNTGRGQINDMTEELYALTSDTINAGAVEFQSGATIEARIALADAACVSQGKSILFIPRSMLPYDITLCPASAGVQRIREGGNAATWDVLAYGAVGTIFPTAPTVDATAAIQAALNTGQPVEFSGHWYLANNLTASTNDQILYSSNGFARITKNANGPILTASGARITCVNIGFRGEASTPTFTGDNVVATGEDFTLLDCGSRWAFGRAVKATGNHTAIIGSGDIYQTADLSATGYDIEIGTSGTVTAYHRILGTRSSQHEGGYLFVDTGGQSVIGNQFGKLNISAGTSPPGVNGGYYAGNRIHGNVTVGISTALFSANHFDAIAFTINAGITGVSVDESNAFQTGATVVNNGAGNNPITRSVGTGGLIELKYGQDSSTALIQITPSATPVLEWSGRVIIPNAKEYAIRDSTGSVTGFFYMSSDDTLWIQHNKTGEVIALQTTGTGSGSRVQFNVGGVTRCVDSTGFVMGASGSPSLRSGSGSPEGVITAPVGSLYARSDGGAATTLYVKESGAGNTGWVAK